MSKFKKGDKVLVLGVVTDYDEPVIEIRLDTARPFWTHTRNVSPAPPSIPEGYEVQWEFCDRGDATHLGAYVGISSDIDKMPFQDTDEDEWIDSEHNGRFHVPTLIKLGFGFMRIKCPDGWEVKPDDSKFPRMGRVEK